LCQFHYADRTKWKKVAGKAILEHAGENDCDLNRDWPNGELDYDLNADDFWDDLANHRGRLCSFTRCMVQTVATAVQENERTPRDKRNPKQRACLDLRDHMLRSMLQPSDESNDGSPINDNGDDSDDESEASATDNTSSDPPDSDSDTPPLPKRKTTAKRAPTESPAPKRRRTSNAAELIRTADSMSVSISQCMAMMMQESQAARLSAEQRSREADERARAERQQAEERARAERQQAEERARADRLQAEERARASEERMAALIAAILARK
jgi:hypothetical protein